MFGWRGSVPALLHGAIVLCGLLVYVLVTRIGHQRRPPSAAIGWVLAIAAFPYLGLPLFLVFGTRKFSRPQRRGPAAGPPDLGLSPPWTETLLAAMGMEPATANRSIRFHADGEASLRELLALMEGARHELLVCSFILGDDPVGRAVQQCLVAAVRRKLRVRLIVDAVGSLKLPRATTRRLAAAGVEVVRFMPLWHNPRRGRTNLRNHRKLVVADGEHVWAGGRNLAVEYFLSRPGLPAWRDLSFIVSGPLAEAARRQFAGDWGLAHDMAPQPLPPPGAGTETGHVAQWVPTGPDRTDDTVHALLMSASYRASARILAVTPYFVPDDALLEAWCMACRRGVRLRLVLPRRSNHRLADLARERALRTLVAAGAEVRLVEGMVHAKAVVFDKTLALCGSANLDARSLFLNYEVMGVFYSLSEIGWLADWIGALGDTGSAHDGQAPSLPRDVLEGIVRAVGYQL